LIGLSDTVFDLVGAQAIGQAVEEAPRQYVDGMAWKPSIWN